MPRTTVNLDSSVLRNLKKRADEEDKSLGDVISEIVAPALAHPHPARPLAFRWRTSMMHARVDLEDKEDIRQNLGTE